MAEGIRIEGLPPLRKILKEVGSLRPVKRGLAKGAVQLRGEVRIYPFQRPPVDPKRIYIRGVGTRYLPTGRTTRTSEKHSKSWAARSSQAGLTWTIGSDTSYGPFLQDERKQTLYHKQTGWKTIAQVARSEANDINRLVKAEIDRALARAR